jgi:glutathione synthase/RimK-type ligase-like ATP-grasp enzyme
VILLCGIPSEPSQARLVAALDELGARYRFVNQRRVRSSSIWLQHDDTGVSGMLEQDGWSVALEAVSGIYLRFMDDRLLPELTGEPDDSPARRASRAFHEIVGQWAQVSDARVVNRYGAMGSNFSKPYQAQLIAEHGFAVPETIVTNDPDLVRAFVAEHGSAIYKSISSERSVVQTVDDVDLGRLDEIRWCPVQFQAFVEGTDVRVHTVGGQVFATAISSAATDYRYAHQQIGAAATMEPCRLPAELEERCLTLAAALGLDLAGIDLRLTPNGQAVCFEVNPSPVYSYYEAHTGQPIALAIARYLTGETVTAVP